jgi:ParB/RepB/Spo0J family partition protein
MTMQTETTKTNGHAKKTPELVALDIECVEPHPNNPRKTFAGIDELAESIVEHGLLEPVMVRPHPTKDVWQLVFGERRWRASKKAKATTILALVRDLDDKACEEIMIVENTKRSDLHPLEEAEGYERMHKVHGLSVEELAAKVNKSVAQIYARMKLCSLGKDARKAFYAGTIDASKALLLARIPHEDLQKDALKAISTELGIDTYDLAENLDTDIPRDNTIKRPLSYREAFVLVQAKYMLKLVDAPFDRGDATLVSKAGACSACPKRTGNQKELFADVASADVCTDPKCYEQKVDAEWVRRKANAKTTGQPILEGNEAKKVFSQYDGGPGYSSGFVDVDKKGYYGGKEQTPRAKLGKNLPPTTLARDPNGRIFELVKRSVVEPSGAGSRAGASPAEKKQRAAEKERTKKERAKRKIEDKTNELAIVAVVAKAEGKQPAAEFYRALLTAFTQFADYYSNEEVEGVLRDRGLVTEADEEKREPDENLERVADKLSEKVVRGLLVEIISRVTIRRTKNQDGLAPKRDAFDRFCDFYKVDPKKFQAEAKASVGTKDKGERT